MTEGNRDDYTVQDDYTVHDYTVKFHKLPTTMLQPLSLLQHTSTIELNYNLTTRGAQRSKARPMMWAFNKPRHTLPVQELWTPKQRLGRGRVEYSQYHRYTILQQQILHAH